MQGSDKHGAVADDALTDQRRQSSAGNRHEGRAEDDPTGLTGEALHAEISRFLGQAAFPGAAPDLWAVARENDATDEVLAALEQLPADRTYETLGEVADALGVPLEPPPDPRGDRES